ncbi:hypothetical protein [Kingella potus]|uniref:hypothetical protein n=1 Tax=Kingella potus TaxID=265175 RepID=UPI001FD1D28E|nr:hypothetical protein [Kingella potus]UOP01612.1 hypothetical protein LVJ84_05460 [Kingella potus]
MQSGGQSGFANRTPSPTLPRAGTGEGAGLPQDKRFQTACLSVSTRQRAYRPSGIRDSTPHVGCVA